MTKEEAKKNINITKMFNLFNKVRYNINNCDHFYSEIVIHLTKACDNKCIFCIAEKYGAVAQDTPDIKAIKETLYLYRKRVTTYTIGGGEPLLYMDYVHDLCDYIKEINPTATIYINTSLPKQCWDNKEKFFALIPKIDRFAISTLHYKQEEGDKIRGSVSKYNRNELYKEISDKTNVLLNFNCITPYFETKEQIIENVKYYYDLGFKNFNLVEIKDHPEMHVDLEKTLGLKLKSPFAYGCHQQIDFSKFIDGFDGSVTLFLNCFLREPNHKKASFWDLFKSITRPLFSKHYFFGVVYEDGSIYQYWIDK